MANEGTPGGTNSNPKTVRKRGVIKEANRVLMPRTKQVKDGFHIRVPFNDANGTRREAGILIKVNGTEIVTTYLPSRVVPNGKKDLRS